MSEVKLGELAPANAARDAIHVAVAPVVACQDLDPGDNVALRADGQAAYAYPSDKAAVGIVDPYLKGRVRKGQRFYLCLYPGTVTSLRHQWEHPAFPSAQLPSFGTVLAGEHGHDTSASRRWLEQLADELDMTYQGVLDAAEAYLDSGHEHCLGFDTPDRVYTDGEQFWRHYAIVSGRAVKPDDYDKAPFRCAC